MTQSTNTNTQPDPASRRWPAVLGVCVAILLAMGVVFLCNAYWRTMASIMPGSGAGPSTSMEPHELTLFTYLDEP